MSEDQYRFLFDKNPLPCYVYDADTLRFLEVNEQVVDVYGYSRDELSAMTIRDIRPPDELQRLERSLATPTRGSGEIWRHRRKDGSLMLALVRLIDIDFAGRPARFVIAEDVTERLQVEERLAYHASHDAMTGLLNREALIRCMNELLVTAEADAQHIAVIYVTFTGFDTINASLGHTVGDEVLTLVAKRLREVAAQPAWVARIGGCEFALLIPASHDPRPIDTVLQQAREALARPIVALGTQHEMRGNFGFAVHPQHGNDPELLLKHASLAAHEAKRLGDGQTVEFSPVFEAVMRERLDLVARLQEAISRSEFELFFQPQFRATDRRPIGVEALIRWRHPERGLIPPAVFIAICEDSGLIVPLGRWVLREACRFQQRMAAAGWPQVSVAVNVSALQFQSGHLVEDVRLLVAEYGLPPGALELELTESIVMENSDAAITTLQRLRDLGIVLSIDDFGTGYSSMSYLRRLPVDKLKIDREFVNHVDQDEKNAAICESIIAMAHRFGMKVVAEGVETLEQLEWLRKHQCDALQGYVLARPMPFDDMLAALGPGK
ncbi:putative bifunctional diguanylate cyclase/phosphodiesterase [Arenimonas oryziterrae]|uniref:cyclic-guanylate-specific phosphodiesterase n=1 Tax=Arenimonas oryziterrae DSM 21050 = YC6267 TaxID=1121015 RepID=A0A091AZQ3_9GAMM|nr:EAL domain-containing protein [Arenimonas oryziterrae]KFN44119.1 hypothetical protein N789_06805 [Arenimonas oryziterrae DSM 21050 = YC6267]